MMNPDLNMQTEKRPLAEIPAAEIPWEGGAAIHSQSFGADDNEDHAFAEPFSCAPSLVCLRTSLSGLRVFV